MECNSTLYKYYPFSANSLSTLINREFYFADPSHFNDPYDCQISISKAVKAAIEDAENSTNKPVKSKLERIANLDYIFTKMETDIRNSGILSLSHINDNTLMWSHYAKDHSGLCLGFNLSNRFTECNDEHFIVGCNSVHYSTTNPFLNFFVEFANSDSVPAWKDFWIPLLSLGFISKSDEWKYEKEVRAIRKMPGMVPFLPEELVEVIFGLNMRIEIGQRLNSYFLGLNGITFDFDK